MSTTGLFEIDPDATVVTLSVSDASLLMICLEIARERFKENALTVADSRVSEIFTKQADDTLRLGRLISGDSEPVYVQMLGRADRSRKRS